jgi:predicted nucleotidyltransferase
LRLSSTNRYSTKSTANSKGVGSLFHPLAPDFPLDLIFAVSDLHKNTLERRKQIDLHGIQIALGSAEDLILLKLSAGRPRDFDDVMGIVGNAGASLDLDYL